VNVCAVIAKKSDQGEITICGIGRTKTLGIKKGAITNIEQAAHSIKDAVNEAQRLANARYNTCVVSISSSYTTGVKSKGMIVLNGSEISISEIAKVVKIAEESVTENEIPSTHTKLHVLPYNFKLDAQDNIEDPLGMTGNRLEVDTYVITVPENSIKNLKKAVELADVRIDNIVVGGYASSISTLNDDEKELGVALIDMGGATCESVIHLGNSLLYNSVYPIASSAITGDLSKGLHTPLPDAENIKINFASLTDGERENIEVSVLGEDRKETISVDLVIDIVWARVKEILMDLAAQIQNSDYRAKLGAGIVLTGGMAKLSQIREIAGSIFNVPVRIAKPKIVEFKGLYEVSDDPQNSCVLGLCLYGAGHFTPYELDSNGEFRYKGEPKKQNSNYEQILDDAIENEVRDEMVGSIRIPKTNASKSPILGGWKKVKQFLTNLF